MIARRHLAVVTDAYGAACGRRPLGATVSKHMIGGSNSSDMQDPYLVNPSAILGKIVTKLSNLDQTFQLSNLMITGCPCLGVVSSSLINKVQLTIIKLSIRVNWTVSRQAALHNSSAEAQRLLIFVGLTLTSQVIVCSVEFRKILLYCDMPISRSTSFLPVT